MHSSTLDLLAIAAHRDDVEQTCGGTLLKMAGLGHRTGILDLTRGEMGTRGTAEDRAREAADAARILKVSWREALDIPDGRVENTWENRLKVAQVIRQTRPRTVILPYWEGRHPDHYTASQLGYEACFLSGLAKLNVEQALDSDAERAHAPCEFNENLQRHDKLVSPVLQFIRRHVEMGVDDAGWYEEQFYYLLTRMLRREQQLAELPQRIDCVRASKRRELMRRLGWATDFMHSNLHRALTLDDLADAARLSPYHFLRMFRQLHGTTPMEYLREQRTHRALALLESTDVPVAQVAQLVGLTRLTLWRTVSKAAGRNPKTLRLMSQMKTAQSDDCAVEEAESG